MANDALESLLGELERGLEAREADGLRRRLAVPRGVDFSSNDYLGLSQHPRIRKLLRCFLEAGPVGAPASRLMRGNPSQFRVAEESFARFKGAEAALFFPSGYQANLGLLTSLVGLGDRVLSDQRNHASIIDGLRLAGCQRVIYPHLDLGALQAQLARPHPGGRTYVVTESLFSTDGDLAPLVSLEKLVRRNNALLIVDDAHATGIFGDERGSGLLEVAGIERRVLAATSTGGKALGLCGAFVTGPRIAIEHILNHARSFIYTTAPLPLLAAGITEAVEIVRSEPWRRSRVHANAARLRSSLRERNVTVPDGAVPDGAVPDGAVPDGAVPDGGGPDGAVPDGGGPDGAVPDGGGPIVPVPVGDDRVAMQVAAAVRAQGYDVRALRPPTVPRGGALLRISVHADHTDSEIDGVCEAIAMSLAAAGTGAAGAP